MRLAVHGVSCFFKRRVRGREVFKRETHHLAIIHDRRERLLQLMRDHAGEMRNEGIAFQHRELCPRLSLVFRQPLVFGERRCEVTRPLPDQCAKPHLIHHEDEDEKRDTGEDPAVLDEDVLECQGFRREGAHPERLIEIAHGVQLPCDLPGERPLIRHREEGDRHGFDEFRAREIQRPENAVVWRH